VLANTAAIEYRMTADVRVLIPKIQALKKTVLDPAVEARTRADNLNAVMNFYEYSGEDPTVLKEIFAGNTYSSYWDEKSVALSFRNLAMWSMDINPTPRAAIQVATQNALYILESGLTTAKMAPYIQEAETYMVKADTLAANLLATVPKFKNTTRYIDYLFWKAFVLGTLAHVKGGDYKTQYIPAYETVLATIPTQKNVFAEPYTQIANWHYAVFLMAVDNNKALAQEKLKKASQGIAIATHPDFVHLIQNKKAGFLPPHSFLGDSLMTMAAISPEFKALIDGIK
jgi:hypothetical protein